MLKNQHDVAEKLGNELVRHPITTEASTSKFGKPRDKRKTLAKGIDGCSGNT